MRQGFQNREEAGRMLARRLSSHAQRKDTLVLALPRGGVPVGYEIAISLYLPLDVFLVRKLGAPGQEELALGAIASGGIRVVNPSIVRLLGISPEAIDDIARTEQEELKRRERAYRADRPPPDVRDRTIILVDDGLATGATMRAAISALRHGGAAKIIVAVPTAPPETCDEIRHEVEEIVCAITPQPFFGVGLWYADFSQTTDEEVQSLLVRAREHYTAGAGNLPDHFENMREE